MRLRAAERGSLGGGLSVGGLLEGWNDVSLCVGGTQGCRLFGRCTVSLLANCSILGFLEVACFYLRCDDSLRPQL